MRLLFSFLLILCCFALSAQPLTEEKTLSFNGELKGTLIIPSSGNKFSLLIIQAGSGPTDRNGNSPLGVKGSSYLLLANALVEKNIAVLLTDKRGIAASTSAGKKEADLRFDMYADDLAAWIRLMKEDKRMKKIFIAGHSEGSLVGMIAAEQEKVKGYISISGAGESIDKILTWQVTQQSPKLGAVTDSLLNRLKNNQKLDTVPPFLLSFLHTSIQPYITSWMKHDPCEEIKKLKIPVMILQGTTDVQVEMKEAERLHQCSPSAEYHLIEGMNHILKQAPAEKKANLATYNNADLPLMPGLADLIINFIKKH